MNRNVELRTHKSNITAIIIDVLEKAIRRSDRGQVPLYAPRNHGRWCVGTPPTTISTSEAAYTYPTRSDGKNTEAV
jgi:hypothetical protein